MNWNYRSAPFWQRILFWNVVGFVLTNLFVILNRWSGIPFDFVSLITASSSASEMLFRPWTVLTYMFAHEGLWHFAFNMWIFYMVSRIFTTFLNEKKLLPLYLAGGLGGFVLYFLVYNIFPAFDSPYGIPILGASASVMAILIGVTTLQPNYTIRFMFIGNVKLYYIAIVYLLIDFVSLKGNSNVGGHLAHLGGAAVGYLMITALKNGKDYFAPIENILGIISGWFKKGTRVRVVYKNPKKAKPNVKWEQSEKSEKQKRTDVILDKISKHGYDNLSAEEKDFLFRSSQD